MPSVGGDVEQLGLSYAASRNTKWYHHYRRQLGVSYKTYTYYIIQQLYNLVFTQRS